MKDIVIIANFCGDLSGKGNNRFLYLAGLLAQRHHVELITSDFDHASKRHGTPVGEFPFQVTRLHESGYPKNICLRRFASHRVWGRSVAAYLKTRKTPDLIYCAVPSLSAPLAGANYCREHGVPFVVDVQDLWPEAFQMVLHVPVVSDLVFAPFRIMAERIYRQADGIAAVSETYCRRALRVNPGCREHHAVLIGTSLAEFDANISAHPVTGKPEGELWLGYCGSMSASYDLPLVMDALKALRERGVRPPKLIAMGDGARRADFERYAAETGVDVRFTGMLPYGEMCGMLSACDITVNPIAGKSAATIINKHGDYAAVGRPVINTQESAEYRALVETWDMGINCPNGDASAMADALERLVTDKALRRRMGQGARRCAEELFDRQRSYQTLAAMVDALCGGTE